MHFFQEGSITQVACCPHDEDFIAVATRLEIKEKIKETSHFLSPFSCYCVFGVLCL